MALNLLEQIPVQPRLSTAAIHAQSEAKRVEQMHVQRVHVEKQHFVWFVRISRSFVGTRFNVISMCRQMHASIKVPMSMFFCCASSFSLSVGAV